MPHYVSYFMCHVSCVTCHVSHITRFFLIYTYIYIFCLFKKSDKVVELVGGGSVINGAYPV